MTPDPDWEPWSTRSASCPCGERSGELPDPWAFSDWTEAHNCAESAERKAA
jgi:hypothetical protein